ncbi:MAG: TetR/AcrR family transcriptional regulator [Selenomonadaceae bacterium]|nr:TetR/AcrR family transcriptional regulator [Selenomonadaceae bacterium]
MGIREQKKLQARQKILDAAASRFKEKGFERTSVLDIMTEAKYAVGTFYSYFNSKEEILMVLVQNLFKQLEENLSAREEFKSSLKLLENCCNDAAAMIDENRFILPLFTRAGIHSDKPESMPENLSPKFKKIFGEIILRGQKNNEIRKDVPADLILEMIHSIYQAAAFSKLKIPFRENIRLKIKILLDGIKIKKRIKKSLER